MAGPALGEPALTATLRVRRGEVSCAATCGALLAAGGGDGALRLWRWHAGAGWQAAGEAACAHRYGVTAAQFARSGVLLATAGVDGAARAWAVRGALAERRVLAAPGAAAARALVWATEERLCVGHDDGALRVWAVRAGALLAHVHAHEGALHAVAAPARAALLLTACTEGVLKVYDFEAVCGADGASGAGPAPLLWEDGAHDLGALCGAGWARGAATGGHDARVRVWRVRGAGHARRVAADAVLVGHTAAVTALAWARGVLASASLDRTARLWAPRTRACLAVLHTHARYLTCVTVARDLSYIVTGSNDRTLRTWSLGSFSLDAELEPACSPLAHFALGDLEGIGPVDDEAAAAESGASAEGSAPGASLARLAPQCECRETHAAAVNGVAAAGDRLATACSDGWVRVYHWRTVADAEGEASEASEAGEAAASLRLQHALCAHSYPALAVDFGAGGAVLLSAGQDGCARLWDVESGCALATLSAAGLRADDAVGGGGGLRDARVSPLRSPQLLVASDDGLAAVWGVDPLTPEPLHVYAEWSEAATCCAWARDGRVCAGGGAAGELLLLAPPPRAAVLAARADAHDLGVLSCDFSPGAEGRDEADCGGSHLLATGGRDARVKLWWAALDAGGGRLDEAHSLAAHEGAVQCVRWDAAGRTLATGGADRWVRVWRVRVNSRRVDVRALAAVPVAAGGALAVCLLGRHVAVGALSGALAVWRLPVDAHDEAEGAEPRAWGTPGVIRWLREYVTRSPGRPAPAPAAAAERLEGTARAAALSGAQLLDAPLPELMQLFGCGAEEFVDDDKVDVTLATLRDELLWLRRAPPARALQLAAPHALRCPLSHGLLREPARAADGYTYERQSFLHWRLASGDEELVSPVSGRRLHSAAAAPNYGVRDALRQFLGWSPPPRSDEHSDERSDEHSDDDSDQ